MLDSIPIEERTSIASFRWLIPLAFTALLTSLSLLRLHLYLATGWDLGFYEQGMSALTLHGPTALSSWAGYPFLARSAAWILWPLAYPYRLLGPDFLLALQAFCYGVGYLFLMDLAEAWGASWSSARLLGWVYLLSPVAWGAALFDFHPAFLAIPCLLAALAATERHRGPAAMAWVLLALATQDLVAPLVVLAGMALVLAGRPQAGFYAMLAGLVVLLLDLVALHGLHPAGLIQAGVYGNLSGWETRVVQNLNLARTWLYLAWVLLPILAFGVTRTSWIYFLPVLPILALNLGSLTPATTSPFTQYSVLLLPPLMVEWLAAQTSGSGRLLGSWRVAPMALVVAFFGLYVVHQSAIRRELPPSAQDPALTLAIATVPSGTRVYCQNFVAPDLADRTTIHPIGSGENFSRGSYVILDTGHSSGMAGLSLVRREITRLTSHSRTRFSQDGVYVLQIRETIKGVS